MFLKYGMEFGRVVPGATGADGRYLFKEQIDAAGHYRGDRPARLGPDVLKSVAATSRREYRGSGRGIDLPAIHFKPVFAFDYEPVLILTRVAMEQRFFERHRASLKNRERAVRIAARDLDRQIGAEHMNRNPRARFGNHGFDVH